MPNLWFEVGWVQLVGREFLKPAHRAIPAHLNGHAFLCQFRVQIGPVNREPRSAVATLVCNFHVKTEVRDGINEVSAYVALPMADVVFKSQQVTPNDSFLLNNEPAPSSEFASAA